MLPWHPEGYHTSHHYDNDLPQKCSYAGKYILKVEAYGQCLKLGDIYPLYVPKRKISVLTMFGQGSGFPGEASMMPCASGSLSCDSVEDV